jgi:hypothetical protein
LEGWRGLSFSAWMLRDLCVLLRAAERLERLVPLVTLQDQKAISNTHKVIEEVKLCQTNIFNIIASGIGKPLAAIRHNIPNARYILKEFKNILTQNNSMPQPSPIPTLPIIPSGLVGMCIRKCIMHTHALDDLSTLPDKEIITIILSRASPNVLERLQKKNPFINDYVEILWEYHCKHQHGIRLQLPESTWRQTFWVINFQYRSYLVIRLLRA